MHVENQTKTKMKVGHTFTIEPILVEGSADYAFWDDEWTVVCRDGGRAAQVEHTLVITEDGAEVLTVPDNGWQI